MSTSPRKTINMWEPFVRRARSSEVVYQRHDFWNVSSDSVAVHKSKTSKNGRHSIGASFAATATETRIPAGQSKDKDMDPIEVAWQKMSGNHASLAERRSSKSIPSLKRVGLQALMDHPDSVGRLLWTVIGVLLMFLDGLFLTMSVYYLLAPGFVVFLWLLIF
mmetsp:Transcript_16158/g.56416  ORF Transcript_16158/g.56416 Transcript_16158/m.56416 type:complete len:163 (+) Transcript_16158:466-954(+)